MRRFWFLVLLAAQKTPVYDFRPEDFGFVRAVEAVRPAVVSVEVLTPALVGSLFGQYERLLTQGGTSGFIVDPRGYVVTLYDQVKEAVSIHVTLTDGRRFPGKLVGADEFYNLAVIQILAEGTFPAVKFADPKSLRIGEAVVSVGFPMGETLSVTYGVVSAKRDYWMFDYLVRDAIQTNADFYRYNRGGPLVNMRGEVVGLSAYSSGDISLLLAVLPGSVLQDVQGLNFAIPADILQEVTQKIINNEVIYHPWLGMILAPADTTVRVYSNMPEDLVRKGVGLVVQFVDYQGPAAKQGFRLGDLIYGAEVWIATEEGDIKLDERFLTRPMDLIQLLLRTPAGGRIRFFYIREGKAQQVDVYPFERPEDATPLTI